MLGGDINFNVTHSEARPLDSTSLIPEKQSNLVFVDESRSSTSAIKSLNLLLSTNKYVIESGLGEPANQISFFPRPMKETDIAKEFETFLGKLMKTESTPVQNELLSKICYPCFCHVFISHPCQVTANKFFAEHFEVLRNKRHACSVCDEVFDWKTRSLETDQNELELPLEKVELLRNVSLKRTLSEEAYRQLQAILKMNQSQLLSISNLIHQKIHIQVIQDPCDQTKPMETTSSVNCSDKNHNFSSTREGSESNLTDKCLNNNVEIKHESNDSAMKKEKQDVTAVETSLRDSSVFHPNVIFHNLKCDFTNLLCADIAMNHIAIGCLDKSVRIMDLHQSKMASSLLSLIKNDVSYSKHRSSDIEIQFTEKFENSLQCYKGHDKGVTCVQFPKSWPYVLSGSFDATCRLWNTVTKECAVKYHGHNYAIHDISISNDDSFFVSAGRDSTCRMWTFDQPKEPLRVLCRHDDSVNSVDFHPNGRFLLSGGNDTVAIMWDLNKAQHVRLFSEQDTQVCAVKFAPNGLYCAVGTKTGDVLLYDIRSCKVLWRYNNVLMPISENCSQQSSLFEGAVKHLEFSADSKCLYTGGVSHKVCFLGVESGNMLQQVTGTTNDGKSFSNVLCLNFAALDLLNCVTLV